MTYSQPIMTRAALLTLCAVFVGLAAPQSNALFGGKKNSSSIIENPDGIPVRVGFIYSESVHSAGRNFSVEDYFWDNTFPEAGMAFAKSKRYASMSEAIQDGAQLFIIAKSTVHGSKKQFKFTMIVTIRNREEKLLHEVAYKEKLVTFKSADTAHEAIGTQLREELENVIKIKKSK